MVAHSEPSSMPSSKQALNKSRFFPSTYKSVNLVDSRLHCVTSATEFREVLAGATTVDSSNNASKRKRTSNSSPENSGNSQINESTKHWDKKFNGENRKQGNKSRKSYTQSKEWLPTLNADLLQKIFLYLESKDLGAAAQFVSFYVVSTAANFAYKLNILLQKTCARLLGMKFTKRDFCFLGFQAVCTSGIEKTWKSFRVSSFVHFLQEWRSASWKNHPWLHAGMHSCVLRISAPDYV